MACSARGGPGEPWVRSDEMKERFGLAQFDSALENNELSPSAIVGCANAALARLVYETPANMAVCTYPVTPSLLGRKIVLGRMRCRARSGRNLG